MSQISFAQNGEDVVLARAFADVSDGFYIDVGASDPTIDSVTKGFYDAGWTGINVEPAESAIQSLREERPRDINLAVALRDEAGTDTFFELPPAMTGCSTFSPDLAERYREEGWEPEERQITVTTLQSVWEEHAADRTVDFLKIDVEGDELAVLRGVDLERFRARVVVVEATLPGSSTSSHESWESLLTDARYSLTLFDGLNRFYLREEDSELLDLLSVPANYFDDYVPFRVEQWRIDALEAQEREAEMRQQLETSKGLASEQQRRAEALEQSLAQTRSRLSESQAALRDSRTELSAARTALDDALTPRLP